MEARVGTLLDEATRRAALGEPGVACTKGCSHCCQVPVNAFPFEVFAIADHVRRTWGIFRLVGLMRRLRAYARWKARPVGRHPWCPFLRDGCCSIYEVRPTICRTHHSTDLEACLRDPTRRPPSAEPFYQATLPLYSGVYQALGSRAGLPTGHDMAMAVGIALRDPDALERFLGGEDPFSAAARRPIR